MIVDVVTEGAGLDAGYLARRAIAATRSLALRHMGAAVCAQVVFHGRYAPLGRGQSRTGDFARRLAYADTFCDMCREVGIDPDQPSERVTDVICYVGPGERGRADGIALLARLQDHVRAWAVDGGHTVAFGLHALEGASSGNNLVRVHLHMVSVDRGADLVELVRAWISSCDDAELLDFGSGDLI